MSRLALKVSSFAAASEEARRLNATIADATGRPIVVFHEGAKANRPLHIQRREQGLNSVYGIIQRLLLQGEELLVPHDTLACARVGRIPPSLPSTRRRMRFASWRASAGLTTAPP